LAFTTTDKERQDQEKRRTRAAAAAAAAATTTTTTTRIYTHTHSTYMRGCIFNKKKKEEKYFHPAKMCGTHTHAKELVFRYIFNILNTF